MTFRRTWPAWLLLLGLAVVAVAAVLLLARQQPGHSSAVVPANTLPVPVISDFPATPPPNPGITPGERVQVAALHIDLPVVPGDGYNAPLYAAALYPTLKVPGEGGRSFLYAHARVGMFDPLFRAQVGQAVDVVRPGAPTLHYRITEYYRRWPINDVRWLQPGDHEQLILSTCTTYYYNDPRIVAVAEPI